MRSTIGKAIRTSQTCKQEFERESTQIREEKKALTLASEFGETGYEFEGRFAPFSLTQSEHM
jgi:hypothetical protein